MLAALSTITGLLGVLSHPEKPVGGSLVQLRLILLRSQAREDEITKGGDSVSAAWRAGLAYFTTSCSLVWWLRVG